MAKAILNTTIRQIRGRIGNLVFRERNGTTYVSTCQRERRGPPTARQAAVRQAFSVAAMYAKGAMLDPAARVVYQTIALASGKSAHSIAVGDYLKPPVVHQIDCSGYRGRFGDTLTVLASDDVEVVSVDIVIRLSCGTVIEHGPAVLQHRCWTYTAATHLAPGQTATIEAIARDRPGNEGRSTVEVTAA